MEDGTLFKLVPARVALGGVVQKLLQVVGMVFEELSQSVEVDLAGGCGERKGFAEGLEIVVDLERERRVCGHCRGPKGGCDEVGGGGLTRWGVVEHFWTCEAQEERGWW